MHPTASALRTESAIRISRSTSGDAPPRAAQRRASVPTRTPSNVTAPKRRVQVHRLHRLDRDAGRGCGHEHLGEAGAVLRGDQEVVRLGGVLHRPHRPAEHDAVAVALDLHCGAPLPRSFAELRRAPGGDRLAREQAGEHLGLRRSCAGRAQRRRDDVRRQQGSRRGVVAELVGHETKVHQSGAADRAAAVGLVHQQRGPPQLGPAPPVGAVETSRVVAQAPQRVRGSVLHQEALRGLRGRTPGPRSGRSAWRSWSHFLVSCRVRVLQLAHDAAERSSDGGGGALAQRAPMPAASLRVRHSCRDMRATSTSLARARRAPTVASSLGVCTKGSQL